ncbi:ribosomal subunit interface protein [Longibacter salinarum]|uniref:Ribosomal subunit interface protein n=1 Tax=Longibacter salinarum TaxID=1850348 RepID=A0A2A8D1U3_9BACT|nr:ribosome-associated translation inhibitor RaiA [Longibacter salinarum]PEN14861.1 ribosomal subunit interface protein [Longibacter salinarum]
MDVRLQGTNIDLTDDLRSLVSRTMDEACRPLGALNRDPVDIDVELEETTRRHPKELEDQRRYRAEANVSIPGRLIRAEGSADDLHQAITQMKHRLTREIRDWRERLIDSRRKGARTLKHSDPDDRNALLHPTQTEEGEVNDEAENPTAEEERFRDEIERFADRDETQNSGSSS